jgi:hypothetical protein
VKKEDKMKKQMKVVQCWDDGITADIPLIEILRKHEAKATFNLNMSSHKEDRGEGRDFKGTQVQRLALSELKDVYEGFTIANHSLSHPKLNEFPIDEARKDIAEGRNQLQQFFEQPVEGFAYPFGSYNEEVMTVLRETGHLYARTTKNEAQCFPPADAMAFHPTCKFNTPEFMELYEQAKTSGVFYFWGHSYEMINKEMWQDFESKVEFISNDTGSIWVDVIDLFK